MRFLKNILKKVVPLFVFISFFIAPVSISTNDYIPSDEVQSYSSTLVVESRIAHAQEGDPLGVGNSVVVHLSRWIGKIFLNISSLFTWAGGQLLELAIGNVVIGFGDWINSVQFGGVIDNVWTIVRDLSNLLFIFGFIFIGIKLILNGSDSSAKSMLAQLIIAALLINFSLFITKAIIEFSNFIAYQIYQAMTQYGGTVSATIVDILKIQTFYQPVDDPNVTAQITGGGSIGFFIMGSIFLFITAFVFFNGAIMLISRFVGLVFIMMFSPILFAGQIFPQTQKYAKDMWGRLLSYSFYAPAYLFLIFVSILVLQKLPLSSGVGFSEVFGSPEVSGGQFFGIVLQFVIAIMVIQTATSLAGKLGLVGSEMALKVTNGTKNFVRRNTVDRGAKKVGELTLDSASKALRDFEYAKSNYNVKTGKWEKGYGKNEGFAAKLGGTKFGQGVLKVDPLLTQIQAGGMHYKKGVLERAAQLKGLRNAQLKRKMDTFLMTKKPLGKDLSWMRKREIMATALAFNDKQDLDEVDPEIMQMMIDTFSSTGQGSTKIIRLRPDAGDPVRYSRDKKQIYFKKRELVPVIDKETGAQKIGKDGKEMWKWQFIKDAEGKVQYLSVDNDENNIVRYTDGARKGQIDFVKTAERGQAEIIDQGEWDSGKSQIIEYAQRTKKVAEFAAQHPRSMANTDPGAGGYHSMAGMRDLQIEELGEAMVLQATGEQLLYLLRQNNAFTVGYKKALRSRAEIGESTDPQVFIDYYQGLAEKAEALGDSDWANRMKGQAEVYKSQNGQRAFGLGQYAPKKTPKPEEKLLDQEGNIDGNRAQPKKEDVSGNKKEQPSSDDAGETSVGNPTDSSTTNKDYFPNDDTDDIDGNY